MDFVMDALIAGIGVGTFFVGYILGRAKAIEPQEPEKIILHGHKDELLYDDKGSWKAYSPPKFTEDGEHPSRASRRMTMATGIRHTTRRVE